MQSAQRLFPDLPDVGSAVSEPSDEDYAVAARYALRLRRLPRAVEQISAALALAPDSQAHLGLLDEILAASRAPLQLVQPPEAGAFFGLLAVRAEVLARSGAASESLALLTEVVTFSPCTAYVAWAARWLKDPRFAARVLPEDVAALLLALADLAAEADLAQDGLQRNLAAALVLATELGHAHAKSTTLVVARSRLLCAMDRSREAHDSLRALGDSPEVAIERALLHRAEGELEACRECYEQALAARPEDPKTWLALGDTWLELAALEAADNAYARANELEPSTLARGKHAYTRALLGGEPESASVLDRLAREESELRPFAIDLAAYQHCLVDPHDELARVIRGALRRSLDLPPGRRLNVRVRASRPLPPSAWQAFQLGLERLGREGSLVVEHDAPERAIGSLWLRDEAGFCCALGRPAEDVLEFVQRLARLPYGWERWKHEARAAAVSFGALPGIVATAACVSAPPDDIHPVEWVHRWQIAVALSIAAMAAPWHVRRKALLLLLADDDWVSTATVLGLVAVAEFDTELRPAVLDILTAQASARDAALKPNARALAIGGMRIANGLERAPFVRLRLSIVSASVQAATDSKRSRRVRE
jgi:tetratricopeptide (TPR) repeat protein